MSQWTPRYACESAAMEIDAECFIVWHAAKQPVSALSELKIGVATPAEPTGMRFALSKRQLPRTQNSAGFGRFKEL